MRALVKMAAGVVVLLALAGCSSDPKSGVSALEASAGPADRLATEDAETLGVSADSVRLLAKEGPYAFYAAVPENGADAGVCLVVEDEARGPQAGCGGIPSTRPLELGIGGLQARLIVDDYDSSGELANGWEQLHQNLLVRGL